ncbi:MAG: hypothetical protein FWD61_16825, partial [Phycisphaerales bacterium]|nr:hypothetical protein [Phycisphaerales bacterium]
WTPNFLNCLVTAGQGDATFGYRMPTGLDQLKALPWCNINQITLVFSEPVNVSQAQLTLTGTNVANYNFSDFSLSTDGTTATWTVDGFVALDTLLLNLSGTVTNLANNALDGQWFNGTSSVSGNGTPGQNFQYSFRVLPGDSDGSGFVDITDLSMLTGNWQQPTTTGSTIRTDFDGSGYIDINDLSIQTGYWQLSVPAIQVQTAPVTPPESQVVSSPVLSQALLGPVSLAYATHVALSGTGTSTSLPTPFLIHPPTLSNAPLNLNFNLSIRLPRPSIVTPSSYFSFLTPFRNTNLLSSNNALDLE